MNKYTCYRIKKEILGSLENNNENLKLIENNLRNNSLVKKQIVKKTITTGWVFKKKNHFKKSKIVPNENFIKLIENELLEVKESYDESYQKAKELLEHGEHICKNLQDLMSYCFTSHIHLKSLQKQDLVYFKNIKKYTQNQITLHRAEKIIQESIYDLRIRKEGILEELREECESYPLQVQPNL